MGNNIKTKYRVLLYFLSLWPLLIISSILLHIFQYNEEFVISLASMLILMLLDYLVSRRMAYADGRIKEKYYKS